MKRLAVMFSVILAVSCCATNKTAAGKGDLDASGASQMTSESFFGLPASSMSEVFNPEFLSILKNASFVQISKLKTKNNPTLYFDPESAEKEKEGKQLSDKEIAQIKDLLLQPSTYRFDIKKKCPFVPDYEIDFILESRVAAVFVSTTCMSLAAYAKGAPIIDFDPKAEALLELIR